MRPDQTDPGIHTATRTDATGREVPVLTDATGRELPGRTDGTGRETPGRADAVPVRTDASGGTSMPRRERAGSPNPTELEGAKGATSWQDIKSRFVDDPSGAIAAAEELVRLAMERRIRALKEEMTALCARGRDEESSSTEGLRTRLIRYQEYCEQLGRSTLH